MSENLFEPTKNRFVMSDGCEFHAGLEQSVCSCKAYEQVDFSGIHGIISYHIDRTAPRPGVDSVTTTHGLRLLHHLIGADRDTVTMAMTASTLKDSQTLEEIPLRVIPFDEPASGEPNELTWADFFLCGDDLVAFRNWFRKGDGQATRSLLLVVVNGEVPVEF